MPTDVYICMYLCVYIYIYHVFYVWVYQWSQLCWYCSALLAAWLQSSSNHTCHVVFRAYPLVKPLSSPMPCLEICQMTTVHSLLLYTLLAVFCQFTFLLLGLSNSSQLSTLPLPTSLVSVPLSVGTLSSFTPHQPYSLPTLLIPAAGGSIRSKTTATGVPPPPLPVSLALPKHGCPDSKHPWLGMAVSVLQQSHF